jgi:hypothetical protein
MTCCNGGKISLCTNATFNLSQKREQMLQVEVQLQLQLQVEAIQLRQVVAMVHELEHHLM